MSASCAAAILAMLMAGAPEARVELRLVKVRLAMTPQMVEVGGEARLSAVIVPREGYAWHSSRLAPLRVSVETSPGWEAEPTELEMPPPEQAREVRGFSAIFRKTAEPTGPLVGLVTLRYAMREDEPEGEDPVHFEEAVIELELPRLERAAELPAGKEVRASMPVPLVAAADVSDQGEEGGPLLPALALAFSTGLLLAGMWIWLSRMRRFPENVGNLSSSHSSKHVSRENREESTDV